MTFLKGLIITMLIALLIIIIIILFAYLVVASDCDDQMGYDDEYERH